MLTEAYIEAPLVDEELADLVWEALNAGLIDTKLHHRRVIREQVLSACHHFSSTR